MAKSKFSRRNSSRQLPPGAIIALSNGFDFFGAFSNGSPRLSQQALSAMRSAWRDAEVREAVRQRQQGRHGNPISFAEIAFGSSGRKQLTPDQVTATREEYLRQQQTTKPR